MERREFLAAGIGASLAVYSLVPSAGAEELRTNDKPKGRLKQSVSRWCFGKIELDKFAAYCAGSGLKSIELVGPKDWPILKKHGLICAMSNSHGIAKGLNRKENHDECLAKIKESIELTAEANFPNVICFSGNRAGMDDDEGMKNCEIAIKQVLGLAENKGVTLCMELLNSRRDHADYMCDRTDWAVELAKKVGSPKFKLLYDIYHMQVQEGNIIETICKNAEYIGHYHTAGVPGRNEFDENQELNYPAIMRAIAETGFDGFVGHEFVPKAEPLKTLTQMVKLCDV